MNRPIRTLAIGCLVLFVALLANITYVQGWQADSLNQQAQNTRARNADCSRKRGPILVDGASIARSVPSHDSLKYVRHYPGRQLYAPVTGRFSCTGLDHRDRGVRERRSVRQRPEPVREPGDRHCSATSRRKAAACCSPSTRRRRRRRTTACVRCPGAPRGPWSHWTRRPAPCSRW